MPQFDQFLEYCDGQYTSIVLVTAVLTQREEESTSVILFTSIRTRHATPTPDPCDGCIVTTALDYRSRPIVYTLGTQLATETLKCKFISLSCLQDPANLMSRLSVIIGNIIAEAGR